MQNILDFELSELSHELTCFGEKTFRAKQVFDWLSKGVESFDQMNNIPLELRKKLSDRYYIGLPAVSKSQVSALDGTVKCLFDFDNRDSSHTYVESVLMRYEYGNSICISSQAGCRMGCKFCASTINGLERNLTSGEMLGQVLSMRNHINSGLRNSDADASGADVNSYDDIRHVVVMGMGEPFDNYDELTKFIHIINDKKGYNLGMRNITVSTCGIVPTIEKFSHDFPQVNLAISLHAPNDRVRRETMPISNKYSMEELLRACSRYTDATGRRITFEYALISGKNDSDDSAAELADMLITYIKPNLMHVNLIPLNEVKETGLSGSDKRRTDNFRYLLEKKGIQVTVRRRLGTDIDAACGQLRNQ